MVIGMIVQAVTKQGEAKSTATTAAGGASTTSSAATTSPIPKSPSYHSNLDQAGGKEFTFSKASLEAVRPATNFDEQEPQNVTSNLNPFTNMGSPLRPRDRNAYNAPPSTVQNLRALKGGSVCLPTL